MHPIPFSPYNRLRFYCIQSNTFINLTSYMAQLESTAGSKELV